ncbi:MAG: LOG family protein, partial [Gimesia sp.]
TGAGPGIMEAAHVGAGTEMAMGVNIMLPFEQEPNYVIHKDEKLVNLNYFFTRKLLFVKEVHAIVCCAGGFGTLDEAFETLTLVQTGKRDPMPIVLLDAPGSTYWKDWEEFIIKNLLKQGLISKEDLSLFYVTDSIEDAVDEVIGFYNVYNSMRYVKGRLVLRLHVEPSNQFVEKLNNEFKDILESGIITKVETHELEKDDAHLNDLPRISMLFNRKNLGRLRQMINMINDELTPDQDDSSSE